MKNWLKENTINLAWAQSVVATLGSLYFSEIMHFTPCKLCWFQRIFMYPLVFILAVGILKKDKNIHLYVLPLSLTGFIIALYHNLRYYNVIPHVSTICKDISCNTVFINWFGFITIPLLSLTAFAIITICILINKKTLGR